MREFANKGFVSHAEQEADYQVAVNSMERRKLLEEKAAKAPGERISKSSNW
jgi:hypothetical protein